MEYALSFFVSFGASVVAYFVCKWLERHSSSDNDDSDN